MFVLQRLRYGRGPGSYVKTENLIGISFAPADLADATKFPSSVEANQALAQRAVAFPDFVEDRFQTVEVAEVPVPPTYEIVRVL